MLQMYVTRVASTQNKDWIHGLGALVILLGLPKTLSPAILGPHFLPYFDQLLLLCQVHLSYKYSRKAFLTTGVLLSLCWVVCPCAEAKYSWLSPHISPTLCCTQHLQCLPSLTDYKPYFTHLWMLGTQHSFKHSGEFVFVKPMSE